MKEEDPRTRLFSHEDLGPYEPISPVKEDPRTRLFSHESLGAYEPLDDDVYNQGAEEAVVDVPPKQRTRSTPSPPSSGDSYYVDPNDPTIETFPCDRKSVMSTLRKIQSSSASTTSGHLLSAQDTTQTPRFSDPRIRRLSGDSNPDDGSNYSTEPVSPKTIPFPRRRDSRASHSSLDKASTSLGAIAED